MPDGAATILQRKGEPPASALSLCRSSVKHDPGHGPNPESRASPAATMQLCGGGAFARLMACRPCVGTLHAASYFLYSRFPASLNTDPEVRIAGSPCRDCVLVLLLLHIHHEHWGVGATPRHGPRCVRSTVSCCSKSPHCAATMHRLLMASRTTATCSSCRMIACLTS